MEMWYTRQIRPNNKSTGYGATNIEGWPLEMEMMQGGMKIKMRAKKVFLDALDDELFEVAIPKGYEKMTKEDLEKMGGPR